MAIIIPDSALTDGAYEITRGEKYLLRKLKVALPDDCLVWHNIDLPDYYQPDILIYAPKMGIIILEVKDWAPETISTVTKNTWDILAEGRQKSVTAPIEQVRNYFYKLKKLFETKNLLLTQNGRHKGNFKLPITYAVAFTNIKRKDLTQEAVQALSGGRFLFREELDAIGTSLKGLELFARLRSIFGTAFWETQPLQPDELDILRGTLYPEITLTNKSKKESKNIVLDIEQEQLAKKMDSGHHIVRGIAGSGKSLVLCAKAKLLAEIKPKWRTLLICFNNSLKSQIDFYLNNLNNIFITKPAKPNWEVYSFYSFLFRLSRETNYDKIPSDFLNAKIDPHKDEERSRIAGEHLQAMAAIPNAPKYDAILVDESQDFHYSWLKGLLKLLNPQSNFIILAEDPNQKIYKRDFTYKKAGLNVVGRVRRLPVSYRSTREIVMPASIFVQSSKIDDFFKQYIGEDNLNTLFHQANGQPPKVEIVPPDKLLSHITVSIAGDIKNGLAYSDIAVICPYREQTHRVADYLERHNIAHYWLVKDSQSKKEYDLTQNKVLISTVHSAKGLEFEKVYFTNFEVFPLKELNDRENASMIYVAMTRAKKALTILATTETEILTKLKETIKKCLETTEN